MYVESVKYDVHGMKTSVEWEKKILQLFVSIDAGRKKISQKLNVADAVVVVFRCCRSC